MGRYLIAARFAFLSLAVLGFSGVASAQAYSELVGRWAVRIDGGGEIYEAELAFELEDDGQALGGSYEADGRDGRLKSIRREKDYYVAEIAVRRGGMASLATFMFDIEGDRLSGDVDFEIGTNVRSYEFDAIRAPGSGPDPTPAAASPPVASAQSGGSVAKRTGKVGFRNGMNGYANAIDTEIWAIAPSKPLDRQGTMTADGNNGGGESQVLMRFDGVFGAAEDQAPVGSRIVEAKLQIVVFDPGSTVYLHRVLTPWKASATWDGLAAGMSVDNVEASTVRDGFSFGEINMDRQVVEFDVTPTVQKWSDGEPNHGWVFVNTGGNGWDFYSSDWLEADLRPTLTIEYETR